MALHFAEQKVNWLTHDVGDPLIGTPEFKVSAVRVEPVRAGSPPPRGELGRHRLARVRSGRAAPRGAASGSRTATSPSASRPSSSCSDRGCRRARSPSPTTRRRDAAGSGGSGRRRAGSAILVSLLLEPPEGRSFPSSRSSPRVAAARGRRGVDRALGADQVAERRDAEPAEGGRDPRRGLADGDGRRRDRAQRQPGARGAPADTTEAAGSLCTLTGNAPRPGRAARLAPRRGSSGLRPLAATAGWTASTASSAPATSCAAGGSPSTGEPRPQFRSSATAASRSRRTAARTARSSPARFATRSDR